jgi:hypothetical protein
MKPGDMVHRLLSLALAVFLYSQAPSTPTAIRNIRPDVVVGVWCFLTGLLIWFPETVRQLGGDLGGPLPPAALVRFLGWAGMLSLAVFPYLGPLVWRLLG